MALNFPPFSLAFIIGGIIALVFALLTWSRRPAPGALLFALLLFVVVEWVFARALEAGAVEMLTKIFWGKMMFLGAVATGPLWFMFALDYTGSSVWRKTRNWLLLSALPLITLIIILTNGWHHLFWTDILASPGTEGTVLIWQHGPWFWAEMVYQYCLLSLGIIVLLRFMFRSQRLYRRQAAVLIFGILVILAANAVYLTGHSPVQGLDLTPFAFIIIGLVCGVTFFNFRFLELIPIARSTVVEKMPDGLIVLNNQGNIIDINPAAVKFVGVQPAMVSGKQLVQVWPELDVIRSKIGEDSHTELVSKISNPKIYFDIQVKTIRAYDGVPAGMLIVLRDITERKKTAQSLAESQSRYEALIEQSNEGVLIMQNGVCRFANRTLAEITGYAVDELIGRTDPLRIVAEDLGKAAEYFRLCRSSQPAQATFELRIQARDGWPKDAELSCGTVRFQGEIAQMVTVRDVTERRLAQKNLENLYLEERRLLNSLQEEINKRSRFTNALVHELRTPLTSVLASSELLESEIKNLTYLALVKNIRRSSLSLEQRINELIELARGEIGMLKINPFPVNMANLLRDTASEIRPIAAGKGLSLLTDIPELPLVSGDHNRLKQVITNLLSNAIKFTGRGNITVSAGYSPGERVVHVHVQDTGRGIDPARMENLFDPYRRRDDDTHEMGGLGIGLALSKMLIELHHGKIWAVSAPGQGSVFSFSVPVVEPEKKL
jgi:PAS domain S-box-containing protein